MTKAYEFNWQRPVPEELLSGSSFDIWEEEKGEIIYEPDATVKVDEFGFFIFWKSEGRVSARAKPCKCLMHSNCVP